MRKAKQLRLPQGSNLRVLCTKDDSLRIQVLHLNHSVRQPFNGIHRDCGYIDASIVNVYPDRSWILVDDALI